jgi:hypothetical protein
MHSVFETLCAHRVSDCALRLRTVSWSRCERERRRPQAPQEPFAPLPSAADAGGVKASAIMTRSLSTPATATVADYDRLTSGSALPADRCLTWAPPVPACQSSAVSQSLAIGKGVQPTPSSAWQCTVPPTIRRTSLSCPPKFTATMWTMTSRNLFAAATLWPYGRGACLQSTLAPARCLHLCLSSQAMSASARTRLRSGGPYPITSPRTMFGGLCGKKPSPMSYVAVSRLCAALIRSMLTNCVLELPCRCLRSVHRMRRYHSCTHVISSGY